MVLRIVVRSIVTIAVALAGVVFGATGAFSSPAPDADNSSHEGYNSYAQPPFVSCWLDDPHVVSVGEIDPTILALTKRMTHSKALGDFQRTEALAESLKAVRGALTDAQRSLPHLVSLVRTADLLREAERETEAQEFEEMLSIYLRNPQTDLARASGLLRNLLECYQQGVTQGYRTTEAQLLEVLSVEAAIPRLDQALEVTIPTTAGSAE